MTLADGGSVIINHQLVSILNVIMETIGVNQDCIEQPHGRYLENNPCIMKYDVLSNISNVKPSLSLNFINLIMCLDSVYLLNLTQLGTQANL